MRSETDVVQSKGNCRVLEYVNKAAENSKIENERSQ